MGEESFLSPLDYSLEEEGMIDSVIGTFYVKAGHFNIYVVIFGFVKEVPEANNMVSCASALREPGLIHELGFGYFVSGHSPHD